MKTRIVRFFTALAVLGPALYPSSLNTWKYPLLSPGQLAFDYRLQGHETTHYVTDFFNGTSVYELQDRGMFSDLQLGLARHLQLNLTTDYDFPVTEHRPSIDHIEENSQDRQFNLAGELLYRPGNDLELALTVQRASGKDSETIRSTAQNSRYNYTESYREYGLQCHWFSQRPNDPSSLPCSHEAYNRPLLAHGQWRLSPGVSWIARTQDYRSESTRGGYRNLSQSDKEAKYWQFRLGAGLGVLQSLQLETELYYIIPFTAGERSSSTMQESDRSETWEYRQAFSYRIGAGYRPSPLFQFSAEYRHYKTRIENRYEDSYRQRQYTFSGSFISRSHQQTAWQAGLDSLYSPLLRKKQWQLDFDISRLKTEYFLTSHVWRHTSRLSYGLLPGLQLSVSWQQEFYKTTLIDEEYEKFSYFSYDATARLGKRLELNLSLNPVYIDSFRAPVLSISMLERPYMDPDDPTSGGITFHAGFRLFL